ncbi:hypothetical protein F53441_20 [Fusarium austroafricanum]|uniref:Uncharacterized protein n=1 Tax=Fusarium austroafricanum TaxID=2364996 RepID=A0A8H4KYY5_9HYPO|nr:hypothetical protein F53441_20 [Fusarium austroafricanum]
MITTPSEATSTSTETVTPKTPTAQTSSVWYPKIPPPTPLKRKRTSSPPDSPIPFKIRKSSHRFVPDRTSKLGNEDLEPNESTEEKEPRPKTFHQCISARSRGDIGKYKCLEYFQAYPHDVFSTLCVDHFMQLAETWYVRRKPMVNAQLQSMIQRGVTSKPDFSHMALPICDEEWAIKNMSDFKSELRKGINDAKLRIENNKSRNATYNFGRHICELGNQDKPLKCAFCSNYDRHNIKGRFPQAHCRSDTPTQNIDWFGIGEQFANCTKKPDCGHETGVTVLGGGQGKDYMGCDDCSHVQYLPSAPLFRPRKYAVEVAGVRIPVEMFPARLALDPKLGHVDVGGIHIIVDNCAGEPLIKFRSTRFSEAHEMYRFDFHEESDVKVVNKVEFAVSPSYKEDHYNEEFVEQKPVVYEQEELYGREGAFDTIAQCSDQFEDCSCH